MTEVGKPTLQEIMDSLTGWDELAIEKTTGYMIEKMADEKNPRALQLTRAVGAVVVAREKNMTYADAYREVMSWPQFRVQDLYAPEPDEVMPDDPDSVEGKGDSPPLDEQRI